MTKTVFDSIAKFFNLRRSRNPDLVGVEIGASTLKVVGLGVFREGITLYFYSIINLPKGSSDAYMIEAIQKALKDNNFASRDAALAFSDESSAIRRMELPRVASGEVANAVKWQAKDLVSFDLDTGSMDFRILSETEKEDGSKFMELLFAAASRDSIDKKVLILKSASLEPRSVSMNPFGIENLIRMHDDAQFSKTVAAVEIGSAKTEISIFRNRGLEFVRAIAIGSSHLSAGLKSGLAKEGVPGSFSDDEIESVKARFGIPYEEVTEEGYSTIQILSSMRTVLERLSKEIRRSIDYYVQEYGGEEVAGVYLTGGGSRLKNLERFLSEDLNIPAKILTLPGAIDTSKANLKNEDANAIAPLIGLASGYKRCPNLLPHEYRAEKMEAIERISLRITAIIAGCALLASFFLVKFGIGDYRNRIKNAQLQKNILSRVKELKDKVAEREVFFAGLQKSEISVKGIMGELSRITPRRIVLESLSLNKGNKAMDISGIVYEPKGVAEETVTAFMEELEKSGYFKDAELASVRGEGAGSDERFAFELNCPLE